MQRLSRSAAILASLSLLAAMTAGSPTAGAARKSKRAAPAGADRGKTLADTVAGEEKLAGLVTFYRSPDNLHLMVPDRLLGQPLGLAAALVHAVGDWSVRGSGLETSVVEWKPVGNRLELIKKNLNFRAAPDSSMRPAVEGTFPDSPVFSSERIPLTDDPKAWLIDAGKLFGPELVQILPRRAGFKPAPGGGAIEFLKVFEDNVVARVHFRFNREERGGPGEAPEHHSSFDRFLGPGRLADRRSVEVTVDFHLFRLPDDGYRPRFADERIGAFNHPYKDYTGIDRRDTAFRHVLARWDVRKADPEADLSPPVEPITFYIDRSVPEDWRPLVRKAALWWNRAFEQIGIRDALRVLDQPDESGWDPADIHHSMIYWNLSDNLIFSGMAGPMFTDPRTGKVLKANVYINGEFPSYTLHRYLVYAWWRAPEPGAPAAGSMLPSPTELRELRRQPFFCDLGASFSSQIAFARLVLQSRGILVPGTQEAERFAREAFTELVAHEVGHALGFPHNWKASLISDPAAIAAGRVNGRNGPDIFSASVMDYDPIYLAPPGQPQGDYFLQELGPYDDLAVEYLYRPFDGLSAEEEARALDAIAARAETGHGLIFDSGLLNSIDPTTNADDLGSDPLAFAESRLRMAREEVLPRLAELVLGEGHDYNELRQALDAAVFSVVMDYIDITARHVGGQILLRRVADSPATPAGGPPPITPVDPDTQRRALTILEQQVFADGAFSPSPDLLAALKADLLFDWNYPWRYASDYDISTRIAGLYDEAMTTLFEPARLARILDNERRMAPGADRFTLPELFERLAAIAFGDLETAAAAGTHTDAEPLLSSDRRSLQRLLVSHLSRLALTPGRGTPPEASQLAAMSLRSLDTEIAGVLSADGGTLDRYSRAHLEDLDRRIRRTLDAVTQVPPGA